MTDPRRDEAMRSILKKMFTGWIIHEESWDKAKGEYTRDSTDCMIEACGGNTIEGNIIHLFDYWGNDIQSLAPFYGISTDRDENGKLIINENVPPPPSEEHYWEGGEWKELLRDEVFDVMPSKILEIS